jgi:hypothetical protein
MEPIQERSGGSGGEVPGETMEIKIKTLDSQSYTIRVAKNVSVSSVWKLSPISFFLGRTSLCFFVMAHNFCLVLMVGVVVNRWLFLL